jgi:hypothetical protein
MACEWHNESMAYLIDLIVILYWLAFCISINAFAAKFQLNVRDFVSAYININPNRRYVYLWRMSMSIIVDDQGLHHPGHKTPSNMNS